MSTFVPLQLVAESCGHGARPQGCEPRSPVPTLSLCLQLRQPARPLPRHWGSCGSSTLLAPQQFPSDELVGDADW